MTKLYAKQQRIVNDLHSHFTNSDFALLTSEVGTGKTYMASALSAMYDDVLIIVPSHLEGKWEEVLNLMDSNATLFVLPKRGSGDLSQFADHNWELIIWDEVHESKSRINYIKGFNTERFLGLSGSIVDKYVTELKGLLNFFIKERLFSETLPDRSSDPVVFSNYILTDFKYKYTIGCTRDDIGFEMYNS